MAECSGELDILLLQPPSPPFMDVDREFEAGFGLAHATSRRSWGHTGSPFFNHSLAWTAGVLKRAGHRVAFADGQAERWTVDDVVRHIARVSPAFVVMLVSLPSITKDLTLLRTIKQHFPETVTVAVGPTCKTLTEMVARACGVDYAACGEAETTVLDLIETLRAGGTPAEVAGLAYARDGRAFITRDRGFLNDLDSLPMIPYRLLPMDKYRGKYFGRGRPIAPIVGSKGCPFACGYYCPYPLGYGDRVRFRSPEAIAAEIELLNKRFGVSHFIFRDQNFTVSEAHVGRLCRRLLQLELDIHWVCETRLLLVRSLPLLKLMKAAGCEQINYGLETGDEEVFEAVAKPGTSFAHIKRAVDLTKKAGIRAHAHVIVGLPGETWKSIANTARLLRTYRFDSVNFGFLVPYPGTRFYEEAKAKRLILTEDWSKYTHTEPVARTEGMSALELKIAHLCLSNLFGGFRLHKNLARRVGRGAGRVVNRLDTRTRRAVLRGTSSRL